MNPPTFQSDPLFVRLCQPKTKNPHKINILCGFLNFDISVFTISSSPDRNRTCIKSLGNFYSIHWTTGPKPPIITRWRTKIRRKLINPGTQPINSLKMLPLAFFHFLSNPPDILLSLSGYRFALYLITTLKNNYHVNAKSNLRSSYQFPGITETLARTSRPYP